MRAKIQRWGNSLAVRIPHAFARESGLEDHSEVEISLQGDQIVIVPLTTYHLDDLLAGITNENRHDEVDSGPSVGNESW